MATNKKIGKLVRPKLVVCPQSGPSKIPMLKVACNMSRKKLIVSPNLGSPNFGFPKFGLPYSMIRACSNLGSLHHTLTETWILNKLGFP